MYQIDNASATPAQPASSAPGIAGFFTDGNPASNIPATIVPAEWLNAVMMEISNVVTGSGQTLQKNVFNQLLTAIRGIGNQQGAFGVINDTGAVNAYAAANVVPLTAGTLVHGVRQRVTIKTTNTGASTYAPDSLSAKPVIGMNLSALQGNELFATQIADLEYVVAPSINSGNGAWLLLDCGGGTQQLSAGSYIVAPPQFDVTNKIPNTAWINSRGVAYGSQVVISAATTLTAAAHAGREITITAGVALTLPLAGSCAAGTVLHFVANTTGISILRQGSDTINIGSIGAVTSTPLNFGDTLVVMSDGGVSWLAIGGSARLGGAGVFGSSLAQNGYQKLPSGLIVQWGIGAPTGSGTFNFPIAFPHINFVLALTPNNTGPSYTTYANVSTTSFTGYVWTSSGSLSTNAVSIAFVAIGY